LGDDDDGDGDGNRKGRMNKWRRMSVTRRICIAAVAVTGAACITLGVLIDTQPETAARVTAMAAEAEGAFQTLVRTEEEHILGNAPQHRDEGQAITVAQEGAGEGNNRELDDYYSSSIPFNGTSTGNNGGNREMEEETGPFAADDAALNPQFEMASEGAQTLRGHRRNHRKGGQRRTKKVTDAVAHGALPPP